MLVRRSAGSAAPLRRGRRFHQAVQTAFLVGLAGASAYPEHQVRLNRAGRGRVDLHLVPDIGERYAVVEIKSTDWDALAGHRFRPYLRARLRILRGYLDQYVANMDAAAVVGDDLARPSAERGTRSVGSCSTRGAPTNTARLQLIDDLTGRKAIMVAWCTKQTGQDRQPRPGRLVNDRSRRVTADLRVLRWCSHVGYLAGFPVRIQHAGNKRIREWDRLSKGQRLSVATDTCAAWAGGRAPPDPGPNAARAVGWRSLLSQRYNSSLEAIDVLLGLFIDDRRLLE